MNYKFLPVNELIASLPPETRKAFDTARFRLALEGATTEEVTAIVTTFGYLLSLLQGKILFDHYELRNYLSMGEDD
uniref:Uncharacterized protein n=1 Tax=candidate division WOR-3 bacterium TaxID=2052148 RepID=A0A7C6ECQ1_UNCW3